MITILLSTYNGARHLPEQLASFETQTDQEWRLVWRDDGSSDKTREIMAAFTRRVGDVRCREVVCSGRHRGAAQSFLSLLHETADSALVAFADQDDVWLPDKLARARATLSGRADRATLYSARQFLVDSELRGDSLSILPGMQPGFPACLTQNIVHGNTLVMNRAAADLVAGIPGPPGTMHDWWSYIVVTACGGDVLIDPTPVVLYRQHGGNLIGSPPSTLRRATAALQRGPGIFMTMMRRHVAQLNMHSECLTAQARSKVLRISAGLEDGLLPRTRALFCPGLRRQTNLENLLFRVWFLIG